MIKIEMFFDYVCPYCYRGHRNLLDLMKEYPQIEIIWRPCEAHPRPEPWHIHSDMAIQGMYYMEELQADLWEYHRLVYEAHFDKGMDISSPEVLGLLASRCKADPADFKACLSNNHYGKRVEEGNRYAWGENHLDAVPSYRSGTRFIGSKDGFLVPKEKLKHFLDGLSG